jgi:O-antigen ligase
MRRALTRVTYGAAALSGAVLLAARFANPYYVPWSVRAALVLTIAFSAWRPSDALLVLAALVPLATMLAVKAGATGVWALPLAIAVLTGWAARVAATPSRIRLPPAPAWAAALLIGITAASLSVELLADRALQPLAPPPLPWLIALLRAPGGTSQALDAALVVIAGVGLMVMAATEAVQRPMRLLSFILLGAGAAALMDLMRAATALVIADDRRTTLRFLIMSARIDEHYGDVNAAASVFVIAAVATLGFALRRRGASLAWLAASAFFAVALWFTGSRIGLAALGLAVATLFLIRAAIGSARQRWIAAAVVAVMLASGLAVVAAMPRRFAGFGASRAVEYRLGFIETSGAMLRRHPLAGIGIGKYYEEFATYAPRWMVRYYQREHAHNNYLQIAAELGFAGLAAWLVLVMAAVWGLRRDDDGQRLAVQAGTAGFLATCVTGHPLLPPPVAITFYLTLGVLAATRPPAARAIAVRRSWRPWIAALLAVALIASVPLRWPWRRRDLWLEHVARGVSQWGPRDPAPRTRTLGRHAMFYLPTDMTAFEFDVRRDPAVTAPLTLDFQLEGRMVHRVVLADERFQTVRFLVPETTKERFLRVDVTVTGPDVPGRDSAVDAGAVMTRLKRIGQPRTID